MLKTDTGRGRVSKHSEILSLGAILAILVLLFSLALPGKFLRPSNLQSMAFQLPELGVLAFAMMITMLTGGINLSIISSANLSGIIMAMILTGDLASGAGGAGLGWTIFLAVIAGLSISLIVGLVNGMIIAYIGVSPILATLGTMTLLEGISLVITRGYVISGLPRNLLVIGNGTFLGVPVPMFILIAVAVAVAIILNKTRLGLSTYMIGSNIKATSFSGINTNKVTILVYMISGLLAGLASLIMIARFNSAKAGYGSSYLLVTVLVSVLGGINPNGGFGKVSGVFLGLVLLQVISSGLNLLGISQFLTLALWGALLLGVEALRLARRRVR
ncbi:MAG: ABC transporter permease [Mesotoga sp.]|uniref:ABC transporter permease n=1 Tax=unclassified Mesotoga TaxID=1184398 RepID=UPI000EF1A8C7|nr:MULTISPECIES: ABC transporter permease [unclassified Mesotoga]MDD2334417.1 ABC transporter permease [Mesotoga sp.]MDD3680870.1 ABC transporter permease [Mesotoga sp.]MDD4207768.1 ABC transporter permease [Mesotoga sp.]MDD4825164.1 ABC transporter permease [Mesotoga sp.]MDD5682977.1 ABC transporter permease [Mesotoga sp.]